MTARALLRGRGHAFARLAFGGAHMAMAVVVGLAVTLAARRRPCRPPLRPHHRTLESSSRSITRCPRRTCGACSAGSGADAVLVGGVTVAVAVVVVLVRLSAARRPGPREPARVVALLLGALVVAWCLVGGLGVYATATLSAQVAR